MSQISICKFINIVNIFNLENNGNSYTIHSYIEKPIQSKQIKQIKRPRLITFSANKDIPIENISMGEFEYRENKYMAILKSNLQKAIRRNLPNSAVSTAIKLFQIHGGSILLLRRLCIIIVEDKLKNIEQILDSYKLLVWIMATEHGPQNWKNWILGLIKTVCEFEHLPINHTDTINFWYNNEYSNYFIIRSYFGGMKGDIRLLQNVAKYIDRVKGKQKQKIIKNINIKLIDNINILKSAVDFHCMPNMLSNIQTKHKQYSIQEIKSAIWIYSSSIRYKEIVKEENAVWKDIKNTARTYQKFILDHLE